MTDHVSLFSRGGISLLDYVPTWNCSLFTLAAIILFSCSASGLVGIIFRQSISPLRRLRGPKSPSLFWGNLAALHDQENNNIVATWEAEFGSVFIYHGFFGGCRLMITDPRAVAYVLGNAYEYPKPDFVRDSLASMAAGHDGLLTSEGEQHRRQRKIISPAFSPNSIKEVMPIFWDKASELRDIWLRIVDDNQTVLNKDVDHTAIVNGGHDGTGTLMETTVNTPGSPFLCGEDQRSTEKFGGTRIDALAWLGRATLDVIGLAGFGYTFNSLTDESNELALAFASVFNNARKFRMMTVLQAWFPILRTLRKENSTELRTRETIRNIGLQLIAERKESVLAEAELEKGESKVLGKDLLSLLIRSNLSSTPGPQQMNTEEILCQISTFMAAGHETTASALVWTLYALSKNPHIQSKLRNMLLNLSPQDKALDEELQHCEYLEWVVRESLRVYAPVTNTMRVCASQKGWDEIPLSIGAGGVSTAVDKWGRRLGSVKIRKGDIISVPIAAVNRRKEIWGEDALEFRPERWGKLPEATRTIPGLWANILTFLNGNPIDGNRSCIGYKFALAEIKVFLYVLLRDLEFSIDPSFVIERSVNVVTRPTLKSEPERGNQMPLDVRRAQLPSDKIITSSLPE